MTKTLIFNSFDGTQLEGILSIPDQEIKAAVLMLHGCPSEKNEDGFYSELPDASRIYKKRGGMAEYFVDQGIASLRFDFREHGDSESTEGSNNLIISGMINDVECAYHNLKTWIPDNVPIFVVAASFAGGISINWIKIYQREIAHLFLMAPLLEFADTIRKHHITSMDKGFESLKLDCIEKLNKLGYIEYGGKKMNKAFLNEAMLMDVKNSFGQIKCKMTIIHGTEDTSIDYCVSKRYIENYNNQCELVPINGAVHGFGIKDDLEWEDPQSLLNHETIYNILIERICHDL